MNKDWLDIAVLEDYLDGKLDAKSMNRVERQALEDPFVAQALEGLSASPKRSLESLSLLQQQLQERIEGKEQERKTRIITWQRLSIAASAAVVFISAGVIFWMRQSNYQESLARQQRQPKQVDVSLAPRVSAADSVLSTAGQVAARKTADSGPIEQTAAAAPKPKAQIYITEAVPVPAERTAQDSAGKADEAQPVAASAIAVEQDIASANNKVPGYRILTGRVLDAETGQPLAGAGIFAGTPPKGVGQTDSEGNYQVSVPENTEKLTLSYTGYTTQVFPVIGNNMVASLRETRNNLNETVIQGYQKRLAAPPAGQSLVASAKDVQDVPVAHVEQLLQGKVAGLNIRNNTGAPGDKIPQPSSGMDKYKAYLVRANRFAGQAKKGSTAEVHFSISGGRPVNITVIRGVSEMYDAELVRLIKNGPGWKVADKAHDEVNLVLQF
ncbi:carboxypeptidase-like regulatory domain-containing protein [Pedobacter sp. JY14-1]|uniref:carboxypeptidase-like regulatory domain-containing protein n=1 Tax=Pedobacter sp. JY14-1 TaxID=3034151 RepID=UPI0023E096AB|nr:carboxypeptidase-like regulatory domain-containing protein [Pedobacter sp. JY14-1]